MQWAGEATEAGMDWQARISVDPGVCHGRACVAGTRVMVTTVLDNLADGMTPEEITRSYTSLTVDDVRAVIAYAAAVAADRIVLLDAAG